MFPLRDVESCEGHEPRAIAFERHECGILRTTSFDSIGEIMEAVPVGMHKVYGPTNTITQVFSPEENVNGAIIRTGLLLPATGAISVFTGTVRPVDTKSDVLPQIWGGYGAPGSTAWQTVLLPYPLFIRPGQGLWIAASARTGGTVMTYDFLA